MGARNARQSHDSGRGLRTRAVAGQGHIDKFLQKRASRRRCRSKYAPRVDVRVDLHGRTVSGCVVACTSCRRSGHAVTDSYTLQRFVTPRRALFL